jgi:hypothetical protein
VQPLWQQVLPQSSPQQAPGQALFCDLTWVFWLNAIALKTRTSERNAMVRFMEISFLTLRLQATNFAYGLIHNPEAASFA